MIRHQFHFICFCFWLWILCISEACFTNPRRTPSKGNTNGNICKSEQDLSGTTTLADVDRAHSLKSYID